MIPKSMWPKFSKTDAIETPVSILREQANLLETATGGKLRGMVMTAPKRDEFVYELDLVAPELDNYTYTLLKVRHSIEIYPVHIIDPNGITYTCNEREKFILVLGSILSSEKVKNILLGLISQIP